MVRVRTSSYQDVTGRIQSELGTIAHPQILLSWSRARVAVELKTMARLLHSTNNKGENIKVGGQYKHKY